MPNDIPHRQNEPEFVRRIAASSSAYDTVKSTGKLQSVAAIVAAVFGFGAIAFLPEASGAAAFFAGAVLMTDFLFSEPRQKRYRNLGARIQELFDTQLLRISWNSHRCQSPPAPEDINRLAADFETKESTDRLLNWYSPNVGSIPLEYARFVCQRANMQWDMSLRRVFAGIFHGATAVIVIAVTIVALAMKWDASQIFISLVMPVLPGTLKLLREAKKHSESANVSERSKQMLEATWQRALTNGTDTAQMEEEARRLQDELFERRQGSPTVPQWLYLWLKPKYEEDMNFGAEEMVKQVQAKLGGQST
jgi:hypothetical protein